MTCFVKKRTIFSFLNIKEDKLKHYFNIFTFAMLEQLIYLHICLKNYLPRALLDNFPSLTQQTVSKRLKSIEGQYQSVLKSHMKNRNPPYCSCHFGHHTVLQSSLKPPAQLQRAFIRGVQDAKCSSQPALATCTLLTNQL